ncbi:Uncharacterised protein [uncultured archaeon]|nr:Uncharacterised protein [uncultured archaeon]
MDNIRVRVGDVLKGQWTLAELSSPVAYGAVLIKSFTIAKIDADPKGRLRFHLTAEDLFYSSIEGWTVPVWDSKERAPTPKEDAELRREQIHRRMYDLTMVMWDSYPDAMKKDIVRVASRKTFILGKKDLVTFMSRRDSRGCVFLEERKIENMLNLPEAAFRGGDAKGLRQQIRDRWKSKG